MDAAEKALNLPNIVENIIGHIFPAYERREIMLTSKAFRNAVYKLEESTCEMIILGDDVSYFKIKKNS